MAGDLIENFLANLEPAPKASAVRLIALIREHGPLAVGIKWRQLTFALDADFDNWICAVSANRQRVHLVFHFGSLLDDRSGAFEPSEAKFVRRIAFGSIDDVDDAVIGDLLSQALDTLPRFRAGVRRRGLAGPAPRRS